MSSYPSLRLSQRAEFDLRSISRYTRESWGLEQELDYTDAIDAALERIQSFPGLGRNRAEFGPEVRSLLVGEHVIIYRMAGSIVEVLRIVHVRMDSSDLDLEVIELDEIVDAENRGAPKEL